jgi:hypothetical protein
MARAPYSGITECRVHHGTLVANSFTTCMIRMEFGVVYITLAFPRDSGPVLKHAKQNSDTTKGVVLLGHISEWEQVAVLKEDNNHD